MPMKNPPHPGNFIRTEVLDPARLSVTAAAEVLRVSRPALSSLLNGKANLSGEMALRIEKAFGVNGHAHAEASLLRHRADSQAGGGNPRAAVSAACRGSSIDLQSRIPALMPPAAAGKASP
jgi:addiction module HigA family antidote